MYEIIIMRTILTRLYIKYIKAVLTNIMFDYNLLQRIIQMTEKKNIINIKKLFSTFLLFNNK